MKIKTHVHKPRRTTRSGHVISSILKGHYRAYITDKLDNQNSQREVKGKQEITL